MTTQYNVPESFVEHDHIPTMFEPRPVRVHLFSSRRLHEDSELLDGWDSVVEGQHVCSRSVSKSLAKSCELTATSQLAKSDNHSWNHADHHRTVLTSSSAADTDDHGLRHAGIKSRFPDLNMLLRFDTCLSEQPSAQD